jgi:uncharacterized protein YacL
MANWSVAPWMARRVTRQGHPPRNRCGALLKRMMMHDILVASVGFIVGMLVVVVVATQLPVTAKSDDD